MIQKNDVISNNTLVHDILVLNIFKVDEKWYQLYGLKFQENVGYKREKFYFRISD